MSLIDDPFADGPVPLIPDPEWRPLTLADTVALFADAPFQWAVAGGYCIEQFVGRPFRPHEDVDILIFRDQQLAAQAWLGDWCLYAADPPGHLRRWNEGEFLNLGIHDIWAHRPEVDAWQFQLMVAEHDADGWFFRKDPAIRGPRDELLTRYGGVPCVRIELQLFYKARSARPKDDQDFEACLPLLSSASKARLASMIRQLFPDGHPWLARLTKAP
jgi:hypothetical protein